MLHGLMAICPAARKGGYNGSHRPKQWRASSPLGGSCSCHIRVGYCAQRDHIPGSRSSRTGANERRCTGDGPCASMAARWRGVP